MNDTASLEKSLKYILELLYKDRAIQPEVEIIGGALIPFCKCNAILKNKQRFCHKCGQRLIWTVGEKK